MTPSMVEKLSQCLENRSRLISIRGRVISGSLGQTQVEIPQIGRLHTNTKLVTKFLDECLDEDEKFLKEAGVKL